MARYKRKRSGSGRKGFKRRRTYRTSALKKIAPSRARRRNFTRAVKKLIVNTAEKKVMPAAPIEYNFLLDGDGLAKGNNASMSKPVSITDSFCYLSRGVNDGERIGEQVRVVSAKLRLLVRATDQTESSILKVWIGRNKEEPGTIPDASMLARLLDLGSVTRSYNGTLLNHMLPNNTDEFTILHCRTCKVGKANAVGFINNDFPAFRTMTFDLTKHIGILKWSQLSSNPTNKHLYIWMSWVNPDGTSPSIANPNVTMFMETKFVDI